MDEDSSAEEIAESEEGDHKLKEILDFEKVLNTVYLMRNDSFAAGT